jgi:hypothetical protein
MVHYPSSSLTFRSANEEMWIVSALLATQANDVMNSRQ